MSTSDKRSQGSAPRPWSLGGDAPEPQTDAATEPPKPTAAQAKAGSTAHTGTDPLGRAIGPAEDPKDIKKVRDEDGKVVTPNKDGSLPESKTAKARREKAEKAAATEKAAREKLAEDVDPIPVIPTNPSIATES